TPQMTAAAPTLDWSTVAPTRAAASPHGASALTQTSATTAANSPRRSWWPLTDTQFLPHDVVATCSCATPHPPSCPSPAHGRCTNLELLGASQQNINVTVTRRRSSRRL